MSEMLRSSLINYKLFCLIYTLLLRTLGQLPYNVPLSCMNYETMTVLDDVQITITIQNGSEHAQMVFILTLSTPT